MHAILAVLYREYKIRTSNHLVMIFYDLCLPMAYLVVFGVGLAGVTQNRVVWRGAEFPYVTYFLAGVLAMTSFGSGMGAAWGFFTDRDNGIFYEFLTYPMGRGQFLFGKILFNCSVSVGRATLTVLIAATALHVAVRPDLIPLLLAGVVVGTAGWFFFLSVFALRIRRNDAFYTLMDLFYFFLLFASSAFYPLDPMPSWLRFLSFCNPLTWQADFLRYASLGVGGGRWLVLESAAFCVFALACFWTAAWELTRKE
jgi:ABC-2 type transport system permease protein